ncbi:Kinesin light chain like [Actinidia chinensis var. chinensis]|uniref:Kinesin light chain like n=1 Tax=Actinidia chinensis var. chinensis TaxID=1590841 RepID=A0A2R6S316_ACTCC|nr:Kinesin light chain like [Actinidia chinensis var. chinensis]
MSLRQAAFGVLRRLRYAPQTVPISSCGRTNALIQTGKMEESYQHGYRHHTWKSQNGGSFMWILLSGQALILGINSSPVVAEDVSIELSSEKDMQGANLTGLRKIEDGSVVSNIHTAKWRVFTDNGRDFFLQGKHEEAEKFFLSALQEAKEGFGERDPHVASAYNNLAELYRIKSAFDQAEPLYLEAVKILEESFGPEDIRVGAALHNLGKFYLVQRRLEEARMSYERALKIKRRVLGHSHTDYADTMYHLGTVLYLQGKAKDSEILIQDSIKIMEEGGLGESSICLRRLRYLAQIYIKSNQLAEAENLQRKILHVMELSKGWNSLDTVIAAEGLGLTLQSVGNLREAKDLMERCLEARKSILPEDHIQIASNMLHIARVEMLNINQQRMTNTSEAVAELDKVRDRLGHSIRIAQWVLDKLAKQEDKKQHYQVSRETRKDEHVSFAILLQSLNALGLLEITKHELLESRGEHSRAEGAKDAAEEALSRCSLVFNKFKNMLSMSNSPDLKLEYLSCLKNLSSLDRDISNDHTRLTRIGFSQALEDEIKRVEGELSPKQKR